LSSSTNNRTASPVTGGRRSRLQQLTSRDRIWLKFAIGVPFTLHILLVWIPAIFTALLSFMEWDNVLPVGTSKFVGFRNYWQIFTIFDNRLFPALFNNLILIVWLGICSAIGMLFAYLLDKNVKGSRFYQSVFYMPVVLSTAVVGFIWKAVMFQTDRGLLNKVIPGKGIDFLGNADRIFTLRSDSLMSMIVAAIAFVLMAFFAIRKTGYALRGAGIALVGAIIIYFLVKLVMPDPLDPSLGLSKNFGAILVASAWRHIGYVMVLYLAGLKGVDPSLREAASIDGANEPSSFRHVVFPVLRPINAVVAVITVIEALRAYDMIAALGNQRGTEVMGTLVTGSLTGEGGGRVGIGSAYGMVLFMLCFGFIIYYVINNFREENA
jgi:multiple sugar transport system permease protein